jgi:hypothetical protein
MTSSGLHFLFETGSKFWSMKARITFVKGRVSRKLAMMALLGICTFSIVQAQVIIQVGTGTIQNTNTGYPAPYGHFFNGAKHQFLILASELTALGASPGNIQALGWDVATVNGTSLTDFTIKAALTNVGALSGWITGLTTCYYSSGYTETAGWNMHNFSTNLYWDGSSNVVFEVCFDNYPNGYTYNAIVNQSLTSFNSAIYEISDDGGVCPATVYEAISAQRPNMKLQFASLLPLDAGVVSIDSPLVQVSPGTHSIYARFRNFGTSTLTSSMIGWHLNGVSQSPFSWTGNLVSGEISSSLQLGSTSLSNGVQQIKAFTYSPNSGSDGFGLNDTLIKTIYVCNPLSGTYYIGGVNPDFSTFSQAVQTLNLCGISGPVVFKVANGIYTEQISISPITGSSPTNTIVFESLSGDSSAAQIQFPSSTVASNNYVVELNGVDYVTFRNLGIHRTGGSNYARVFYLNSGAHHNTLENCYVSGPTSIGSDWNFDRTLVCSGSNSTDTSFRMAHCLLQNGSAGLFFGNLYFGYHLTVDSNSFLSQGWKGIFVSWMGDLMIRNNTLQSANGVSTYDGIYLDNIDTYSEVVRNIVINPSSNGNGIYLSYSNPVGTPSLIANNFIHLNTTGNSTYGIILYNCANQEIAYNSINITGSNSSNSWAAYLGNNNYNIWLRNNILANQANGFSLGIENTVSNIISNYNCHYSAGSWLVYTNVGNFQTLNNWKSASNLDINSIFGLPAFTSNSDLHTNSGLVSSAGTSIAAITNDIDGDVRPAIPDIGADEFTFTGTDAAITLISPESPTSQGNKAVTVRVNNTATNVITSTNITYTDGVSSQSQNFTGLNLQPGTYTDLTFTTPYNFTKVASFRAFIVSVNGATDLSQDNDSTQWLYLCFPMAGTYTINPAVASGGSNFQSIPEAITAMNCGGITGHVVFNIAAGTYNQQVSIPPINGASVTSTVTFQSANGDSSSVVFTFASTVSGNSNYTWVLDGADYIKLKKISIRATGTSYGRALVIRNDADYNEVSNCQIFSSTTTSTSNEMSALYSPSTNDDNCIISNNLIQYASYGIFWAGAGTYSYTLNNVFSGNQIKDFYRYGAYFQYHQNMVFQGNALQNASNSSTVYSLFMYYLGSGNIINANRLVSTGTSTQYGIYMNYCNASSSSYNVLSNNFICHPSTSGVTQYGIYHNYSNFSKIAFNSMSLYSSSSSSRALYIYYGDGVSVRNNLLINQGTGYSVYYLGTTQLSSNYNCLFTNGSYLGYYNNNFSSLSSWVGATGFDLNSKSLNPGYSSATDLHISSVILNGSGQWMAEVASDIDGETRSITPDMGADEYFPTGLDANITWIAPVSPVTPGAQAVQVMIGNTMNTTINSISLSYSDGSTTQTQAYSSLNLLPGEVDTLTFNTTITINSSSQLRAFINQVNGTADAVQTNDTTAWQMLCVPMAGNYTINPALPATGSNFQSFTQAVSALLCGGVTDSVIISVSPGAYTEQIRIPAIAGAGILNRIVFRGPAGDSTLVTLQFTGTSLTNYVLYLDGADYITFDGITIKALDTYYARCVLISNGANNNLFHRNQFISSTYNSSDNSLIYCSGGVNQYNVISNNYMVNGYYGIYYYGTSSPILKGVVITDNIITGFQYMGIYLYYLDSVIVRSNVVTAASNSNNQYGIYLYNATNSSKVDQNKVTLFSSYQSIGIRLYYTYGNTNAHGLISNNFVMLPGSSSTTSYGIMHQYSDYIDYYHNSVFLSQQGNTGMACYIVGGSGNNVANNAFVTFGSSYAYYVSSGASQLNISNFNNYVSNGTNLAYWGGTNVSNLPALLALNNKDTNSISINPSFIGNTDLHTYSNAMDNLGTPLAAVSVDIDGELRSLTAPDIGADEYSAPNIDLALLEIVGPESGCSLGNETLVVRVLQLGSDTLTSGVSIFYQSGNSTPVQNAVTTTIYPGDTLLLSCATPLNMLVLADSTFELKAWAYHGADPLHGNDTASVYIFSGVVPPAPSVISSTVLGGSPASLVATGSGEFYWYNDSISQAIIYHGDTLVTPPLWDSTTYYVEAFYGSTTGAVTLGTGMSTLSVAPTNGWYNFSWSAMIFTAAEINSQGLIDSIAVNIASGNNNYFMNNQRVYLAHTSLSDFNSSTSRPDPLSMVKVFDGAVYWPSSGWKTLATASEFTYNGNDNLLIYWENLDGSYTGGYPSFYASSTGASTRLIYNYSDQSFPTGAGSPSSTRPNFRLTMGHASCPSERVPAYANVIGTPAGLSTDTCMDYGQIMQYLTSSDSLYLKSTGSYMLKVLSISNQLPQYSYSIGSSEIVPGDSTKIKVTVASNQPGIFFDTLDILTNAGLFRICLYSLFFGAPVDSVSPASFNAALTDCQDTLNQSLTIYNTGLSDLIYTINGGAAGMATSQCTPATTGHCCDMGIYNVGFHTINNSSGGGWEGYQNYTASASTTLRPGASYQLSVSTGPQYSEHVVAWIDYNNNGSFESAERIMNIASQYVTHIGTVTVPPNAVFGVPLRMRVVSEYSGNSVPGPCTNVQYGQHEDYTVIIDGGIDVQGFTDTIAPGSNAVVPVSFSSTGLWNGAYYSQIHIATNNPLHPAWLIPCTLVVNGQAVPQLTAPCLDFDSVMQFTTVNDTLWLVNSGCNSLQINNVINSNSAFTFTMPTWAVDPYDTIGIIVSFNPQSLGLYNDTLKIFSNVGQLEACLRGEGIVIPVISAAPAAFNVSIQDCNDSLTLPLTIYNSGQGILNYYFASGYGTSFDSTSQINYNTYGYQSVHTFNMPLTMSDSLLLEVTLNGDFDAGVEYANLYIDNQLIGTINDNNLGNGTNILTTYQFAGNQVANWLADGVVQVRVVNSADVDAFSGLGNFHIVRLLVPGTSWINLSTSGGTVLNNDSSQINVEFNAMGMRSGTYQGSIRILSNDPLTPTLNIPSTLTVVGSPGIQIEPSCVAFGNVVENALVNDSFMVINTGCDTLEVTLMTAPYSAYSLSLSSFNLLPRDTQYVVVTFSSATTGSYNGNITIQSNLGTTPVCVSANCVDAASISLAPISFSIAMTCDEEDSLALSIGNVGLGVLQFLVRGGFGVSGDSAVLIIRDALPFSFNLQNYLLNQFGVEADVITSSQIAATDFNLYDLIITSSDQNTNYYTNISSYQGKFESFANNGGVVLYLLANFSIAKVDLAGNVDLNSGNNEYYANKTAPSHPIYSGLPNPVYGSYANYGYLSSLPANATILFKASNSTLPVLAEFDHGRGRIIASAIPMEMHIQQGYNSAPLLANTFTYSMGLLGDTPDWLSINPVSGTVPSGDSSKVFIKVNSDNMFTGTYQTNVFVESNDPLHYITRLPVNVSVSGSPELSHSQTGCIDFQNVLVGATKTDSILISNPGCDTLKISSILFNSAHFSVTSGSMNLAPGMSVYLSIRFSPLQLGQISDTAYISGNAPPVKICVLGYGSPPPLIGVNPSSISKTILSCNDSTTHVLSISNTGTGSLSYQIPGVFGSSYDVSSTKYITYNGQATSHSFSGLASNLDSIYVTVVLNGDFDDAAEYASLSIDGTNLGQINDMNLGNGTNITVEYAFGGSQLAAWLSDGSINVIVQNASNVDVYSSLQNLHKVTLSTRGVRWLVLNSTSGTVAAGNSNNITLKFRSQGIVSGTYIHQLPIRSNDPINPQIFVPCTLTIDGEPVLQINTQSISFASIMAGSSVNQTMIVSNTGCDTLHLGIGSLSSVHFNVSPSTLAVAPGQSGNLIVTFAPQSVGQHSTTINVSSDGGNVSIPLSGTGEPAPAFVITGNSILDTLECEQRDTVYYRVSNNGAANLIFNIGSISQSWLSLPTNWGTILPSAYLDLPAIINKTGLAIGDYEQIVIISTNDPVHPIDTLRVKLHVPNIIQILNLGPDVSICGGNTHTLNAGSGYASYMWSTGSPAQAVQVQQSGSFSVTVSDAYGCVFTDQASVTVFPIPTGNAGTDTAICEGNSYTLTGSIVNGLPPFANSGTAGSNTNFSSASYISPFGTYYSDQRMQYLVKASELTAAGLSRGDVTSIAFKVSNASPDTLRGFSVRMGSSTLASLTGFIPGLPLAAYKAEFNPTNGWCSISFDYPFYWDGIRNVLVEVCWDNSGSNYSSAVEYSYIYNSTCYRYANNASGCNLTNGGVYYYRPNIRFNIDQEQGTFQWSGPNGFSSNLKNPTIQAMSPIQSGDYTLQVNNGIGCTDIDSVVVNVNPVPQVSAGTDQVIFENDTASLSAIVTGGVAPYTYQWSPAGSLSAPNAPSTNAWPLSTTTYTLSVFGANQCQASDAMVVNVIPLYNVNGQLSYLNTIQLPMSNSWVYLTNVLGQKLDSSMTNSAGSFSFLNKEAGNYRLSQGISKPWGGVNSTDALLVQKHVIQMSPLNGLYLKAADVSGNGNVSSLDALKIMRRTIGLDNSFATGDWAGMNDTLNVVGSDRVKDIKTLAFGDVNGSYMPLGLKKQNIPVLREGLAQRQADGSLLLPISIRSDQDIGAITLFIDPGIFDAQLRHLNLVVPGMLHNQTASTFAFAWADPAGIRAGSDNVIAYMTLDPGASTCTLMPKILDGSEISGINAEQITEVAIIIPKTGMETEIPADFILGQNYPNPFVGTTQISYALPMDANVRIYVSDVLGRVLSVPINGSHKAGYHILDLQVLNLPAGIYSYTMEVTVAGQLHRISNQMVVTR